MNGSHKKVEGGEQLRLFKKRHKDMTPAERVEVLQEKLYQKAKQEKAFRFYVLYDKMYIPYMLEVAWEQVKSNKGAPGIDGVKIEDIEANGAESYLQELGEELRNQTYQPKAVKRVMIPKANGGERPLGIPTVKDRIAQTVCKMILEPIFETDFEETSYGFRPDRSSGEAIEAIKNYLQQGKTEVLDADLSNYFDSIPHDKLLIALRERVTDPRMLKLIMKWLKAPYYENGQFKGGRKNQVATPQGGVISPLLANIYLHLFDRIVANTKSVFGRMGIKIVRYADDFVLMGKEITTEIREKVKGLLARMGLTLNEEKTHHRQATLESFDFLGFTIRYDEDLRGRDKKYWNIHPSRKSEKKIRDKVKKYLHTHGHSKARDLVDELNSIIRGWLNYFELKGISYPAMSKRRLRHYLGTSLTRYYKRKSQRKCRLYGQNAYETLVQKYGLIDPTKYHFQ